MMSTFKRLRPGSLAWFGVLCSLDLGVGTSKRGTSFDLFGHVSHESVRRSNVCAEAICAQCGYQHATLVPARVGVHELGPKRSIYVRDMYLSGI